MDVTFVELDTSRDGMNLLKKYYETLHVPEFPDPNERESFDNLEKYLEGKDEGWYGKNNYHIVLMMDGDVVAGGTIFDYYEEVNAGFGEFITINRNYRKKSLFKKLFDKRVEILNEDARRNGHHSGIDWLVVEMNKPEETEVDAFNPNQRLKIWEKLGFKIVDMNYIQPALEEGKDPVTNLYLVTRIYNKDWPQEQIESKKLIGLLYNYVKYAFDIEDPYTNKTFMDLKDTLEKKERVRLLPMV